MSTSNLGSRKRGTETLFRNAYRLHSDLTTLADNKANLMVGINGILLSVVLASAAPKVDTNTWLILPVSVLAVCCLVSLYFAIRCAVPRVTQTPISLDDVRNDRANPIFFGHFVQLSEDEYVEAMDDLLRNRPHIYHAMMRDLHGLGQVLQRKYTLLRVSYTVFLGGLIVSVLLFLVTFYRLA